MTTVLLSILIATGLLLARHLWAAGRTRKVIVATLTALLMIPVWDKAVRLAEATAGESDQAMQDLLKASAPFDRFVALRTEEALLYDDRLAVSALRLITTAKELNFRSGPRIQAPVIHRLSLGTLVVKCGRRVGKWTPVEYGGHAGWVSSAFLAQTYDLIDTFFWRQRPYFTIGTASVFRQPGYDGTRMFTLSKGTRLVLEERRGVWIKIKSAEHEGWVDAKLVRVGNPAEAQIDASLAVRFFLQDAFPQEKPLPKLVEYFLQILLWVALALMRRPSCSLLDSLAANRIPGMFAANVVGPALWFGVNNRPQLLLMSDNEKLVIAVVAVAFTSLTWVLVDAIASRRGSVLPAKAVGTSPACVQPSTT